MDQNGNVIMPVIDNSKQKNGAGLKITTTIALILAIAGIGFGVYSMLQISEKDDQISSLKTQVDILKNESAKDDEAQDEYSAKDYIYVGEWGLKFKVPSDLEQISYKVRSWSDEDSAGTSLCISAALTGYDKEATFAGVTDGIYVCIARNVRSASEEAPGPWQSKIPVGEFYIEGPQAVISVEQSDIDWEVASVNRIKEWLGDESARSSI